MMEKEDARMTPSETCNTHYTMIGPEAPAMEARGKF